MLFYIILAAQAMVIGALVYKTRKDKEEFMAHVEEAGDVGAQYVELIHKQQDIEEATKVVLNTYDELKSSYNIMETSSIEQDKLIDKQYEMIQAYDNKIESLQEKLLNSERLRMN
jgi:hypothetical protein